MTERSSFDKKLLEPYDHLVSNNGKQFRNKLIQAFNVWLKIRDEDLTVVTEIIDLLHNSSLLIDDIEDNSELRRGKPVSHKVFGVASTLNCGNFCYFLALEKLLNNFPKDKLLQAVGIYTTQMLELHRGQGLDIYWRDRSICPSEEEYMDMVRRKTGGLFGLGVKLIQLFSDWDRDLTKLIDCLGEYFQIRDDYANLMSDEYKENKSFAEDLTEGKYSFPVIHAIINNPYDSTILDILKQRTKDVNLKELAIKKMAAFGSLDYTLHKIKKLDTKLIGLIEDLGGNPMLTKLVDVLRAM